MKTFKNPFVNYVDRLTAKELSRKEKRVKRPKKPIKGSPDCRICSHFRDTDSLATEDYRAWCNISGVILETYQVCDNYERSK